MTNYQILKRLKRQTLNRLEQRNQQISEMFLQEAKIFFDSMGEQWVRTQDILQGYDNDPNYNPQQNKYQIYHWTRLGTYKIRFSAATMPDGAGQRKFYHANFDVITRPMSPNNWDEWVWYVIDYSATCPVSGGACSCNSLNVNILKAGQFHFDWEQAENYNTISFDQTTIDDTLDPTSFFLVVEKTIK
jgi:hypothetical protein